MKKLAIFVEGQTEQIFVKRLLIEIAGEKNICIVQEKAASDKRGDRIFTVIDGLSTISKQKYYVLIRNCCTETCVKSDIIEACEKLAANNYEKIIGLRDVYPIPRKDINKLVEGLKYNIPTKFVPIHILLAVMEVEAWFLAETTHFLKIDQSLTLEVIKKGLKFDPSIEDIENRPHPAEDLDNIYKMAGYRYTKRKSNVERTVNVLDYGILYLDVNKKVKHFGKFVQQIDTFLS